MIYHWLNEAHLLCAQLSKKLTLRDQPLLALSTGMGAPTKSMDTGAPPTVRTDVIVAADPQDVPPMQNTDTNGQETADAPAPQMLESLPACRSS